ncbi:hypothetical protein GTA51_03100 [Desulfovibrio aerotolerans]|uniref:Cobalamin biosynthesis protein CbiL n=2 Tax=Solidesulfovibrio aerotolerans TaxID=295255 RepID=A0A7C9IJC8_9BACT|nr:hypothetical protein [Solidesulfovibrio aerotolerans]
MPGVALLLAVWACPALAHRVNVFAYVEGNEVVVECSYSRSERVRFGEIAVQNAATGAVYLTGKTDEKGAFRFPVPPAARAAKADLRIVLRAGEGHQNGSVVTAGEYQMPAASAAPAVPAVSAALAAPAGIATPAASAGPASPASAADPVHSPQMAASPAAIPATTIALSGAAPAGGPPRTGQTDAVPAGAPVVAQAESRGVVLDPAALSALVEAAVEKKIAPLRAILVGEKEKGPGLTEILGGIGWLVGLAGIAAYAGSRRGRPGA